jgi:hypothetical protein
MRRTIFSAASYLEAIDASTVTKETAKVVQKAFVKANLHSLPPASFNIAQNHGGPRLTLNNKIKIKMHASTAI